MTAATPPQQPSETRIGPIAPSPGLPSAPPRAKETGYAGGLTGRHAVPPPLALLPTAISGAATASVARDITGSGGGGGGGALKPPVPVFQLLLVFVVLLFVLFARGIPQAIWWFVQHPSFY